MTMSAVRFSASGETLETNLWKLSFPLERYSLNPALNWELSLLMNSETISGPPKITEEDMSLKATSHSKDCILWALQSGTEKAWPVSSENRVGTKCTIKIDPFSD